MSSEMPEILLDDESIPLWVRIRECMRLLDLALIESKKRGQEMVLAEARYYTAKANEVLRLKNEEQMPATLIPLVVKGSQAVVGAMQAYHQAQVDYENAREARNVYKKELDTLREEYEREYVKEVV